MKFISLGCLGSYLLPEILREVATKQNFESDMELKRTKRMYLEKYLFVERGIKLLWLLLFVCFICAYCCILFIRFSLCYFFLCIYISRNNIISDNHKIGNKTVMIL